MSWLELHYVERLGQNLPHFKKISNTLYKFPCPNCLDWSDSKRKYVCVCYVYSNQSHEGILCHRCSYSHSLPNLIRDLDSSLFHSYLIDKLKESGKFKEPVKEVSFIKKIVNKMPDIPSIMSLPEQHFAKTYVRDRQIPMKFWDKLFYAERFMHLTNIIIPDKFNDYSLNLDEPRLFMPFFNESGDFHAFQGRTFKKFADPKYILVSLNENIPSVFGLDRVDWTKDVIVTEGPIDSLFLDNAIAAVGGNLVSKLESFDKSKIIIAFDNEPRSVFLKRKIERAIVLGYRVVIWPSNVIDKDINQMIKGGMSASDIENIIRINTYKGLSARAMLSEWKKV